MIHTAFKASDIQVLYNAIPSKFKKREVGLIGSLFFRRIISKYRRSISNYCRINLNSRRCIFSVLYRILRPQARRKQTKGSTKAENH